MNTPFGFLILLALVGFAPDLTAQTAAPASDAVTLEPGDLVRVTIWREEDLSGEFPVDQDGIVTLPLIGEKQVTGVPMRQLRDLLIEDYRVHLRNPSINITPLRRINVLGEVRMPGLYLVDPTISLAGAVGMAGGATATGDLRRIRIVRDGEVVQQHVAVGTSLDAIDIRSGDQIFVERRGWFDRNSTFVVSALLSVTSIIISFSR